ncbi:DUF3533 domain-containing protein [Mycena kentingensis (nom. inval.)]|nr:DUF3533 domain-containing protein [Mycena kentingensis (nom. inval.)]
MAAPARAPSPEQEDTSASHTTIAHPSSSSSPPQPPFSSSFFDKSPEAAAARAIYFKTIVGGIVALSIVIFAIFSIYWGSLWHTPVRGLPGWIVDFDAGPIGTSVSRALSAIPYTKSSVEWTVRSASDFPGGLPELEEAIAREKTWYALAINAGASANLTAAVAAASNASYTAANAITFVGAEARQERAYAMHLAVTTNQLQAITHQLAVGFLANLTASGTDLGRLASGAPDLLTRPVYYTIANIRPFDVPVANAVTFVGLIYLVILSFFIVMVSDAARNASGLNTRLTLRSLILLRLLTMFAAYFFISVRLPPSLPTPPHLTPAPFPIIQLFYTLLNLAFHLPFQRHYGRAGFPIFWALSWVGMLALGLALESLVTILTARFIPFFLITWIIVNVSTAVWALEMVPRVFRYGFAFPFYNISRAVRSLVFGTKNELGLNFGVLLAWVGLSCVTLAGFQWWVRRGVRVGAGRDGDEKEREREREKEVVREQEERTVRV